MENWTLRKLSNCAIITFEDVTTTVKNATDRTDYSEVKQGSFQQGCTHRGVNLAGEPCSVFFFSTVNKCYFITP